LSKTPQWRFWAIPDLIGDSKANLDQLLNLTLLESRNYFSRCALHDACRERLGCTPPR
jgi:hypothetical protein